MLKIKTRILAWTPFVSSNGHLQSCSTKSRRPYWRNWLALGIGLFLGLWPSASRPGLASLACSRFPRKLAKESPGGASTHCTCRNKEQRPPAPWTTRALRMGVREPPQRRLRTAERQRRKDPGRHGNGIAWLNVACGQTCLGTAGGKMLGNAPLSRLCDSLYFVSASGCPRPLATSSEP